MLVTCGARQLSVKQTTDDRVVAGSNPSGTASKLGHMFIYPTLPVSFVGPFTSMPGEVKDPHAEGVNVTWTPNSEINHSCVSPRMGCLEYYEHLDDH